MILDMLEAAFHKLKKKSDFNLIQVQGFTKSGPPQDQWLGEGIYFFLNPNGRKWAYKWPFGARGYSSEGIVETTIDTAMALDFRLAEVMTTVKTIVNKFRIAESVTAGEDGYKDGSIMDALIAGGMLKSQVGWHPSCIIADFDINLVPYREQDSRVLLNTSLYAENGDTAQVQACVIDESIIGHLALRND